MYIKIKRDTNIPQMRGLQVRRLMGLPGGMFILPMIFSRLCMQLVK